MVPEAVAGGSGELVPNGTEFQFCAMKQFWGPVAQPWDYFKHRELHAFQVDTVAKFMLCVSHHILFKTGASHNNYYCKETFYCKSVRWLFKDDFNAKKKKKNPLNGSPTSLWLQQTFLRPGWSS